MIIWQGYGILAFLIPLPLILTCGFLIRSNGVGYLLGGVASAEVLWFFGRRLNHVVSQEYTDADTGKRVQILAPPAHTLYFIPMQYWAFVWLGIAVEEFVRHM